MNERENKAIETFVVAEFRKFETEDFDFCQDVQLSSKEKAALASVSTDFLDLVFSGKKKYQVSNTDYAFLEEKTVQIETSDLVLNRADDVEEADLERLKENERRLIERKIKEKRGRDEPRNGS